jgi:hypothetical protein
MLVFALSGCFESTPSCQNNILISTTVPKGIEWHFHPAFWGTIQGARTFWGTQKLNCQWACKGGNCSPVCWTGTNLGGFHGGRDLMLEEPAYGNVEGLTGTYRQAWKLISGPSPTAKTRLLSFNRIQSWVVTVLLTGHNIPRRHLYIMGLIDSP